MTGRSICLIGMPGAGKSRVAAMLAERLGRRAVDTDDEIVNWVGQDIPTIFEREGEAAFRRYEHEVIRNLATINDLVIALGGGAVLNDANVAELLLTGTLVHLDCPVHVLASRLKNATDRPLLAGDVATKLEQTYTARDAIYRHVSDITVNAAQEPHRVAEEILQWAIGAGDILTPSEHEQVMT
ncbi:MAG: shikimate kinase [Nitriliruptoraceae bacterium]